MRRNSGWSRGSVDAQHLCGWLKAMFSMTVKCRHMVVYVRPSLDRESQNLLVDLDALQLLCPSIVTLLTAFVPRIAMLFSDRTLLRSDLLSSHSWLQPQVTQVHLSRFHPVLACR